MQKNYDENEIRADYRRLTLLLIEKELTLTTMESVTGGQIASLITDTEGSSAVLKGAFVTYSNEAKILQGVARETVERFSVYSEETAAEMARACAEAYGADVGIGVTGTAGNTDPANPGASVPGELYFAIGISGDVRSRFVRLPPQPDRLAFKLAAAKEIFDALWERLTVEDECHDEKL